jgi:WD40 repeat protein
MAGLQSYVSNLAVHPNDPNLVAVARSNLTGNTWNGQIEILSFDSKDSVSVAVPAVTTNAGNCDVEWFKGNLISVGDDGAAYIWTVDRTTDQEAATLETKRAFHSNIVTSVSAKDEMFLTSSWDRQVALWTPDQQSTPTSVLRHPAEVNYTRLLSHRQKYI